LASRKAEQADLRRRREPTPAVDDERRDDAAVAAGAPALLQHRADAAAIGSCRR